MVRPHLFVTLILLSSVCTPRAQAAPPREPAQPAAAAPLRIGILGASVSDGQGCRVRETRADGVYEAWFRLADMVTLVCVNRPLAFEDRATSGMGFNPRWNGSDAAATVFAANPQCVIALDFLFWYCYGQHGPKNKVEEAEARRLATFEQGLSELARFQVPIVVGDIPDMSRAVGKILPATFMPPLESIAAANARLSAWAKEHPNVRIVPLSKLIRQLHEEKVVEVAGKRFAATVEQPLMQDDELHATPAGLAAIACVLVDELAQVEPTLALPRAVDPAEVVARARATLAKKEPPRRRAKPADAGK